MNSSLAHITLATRDVAGSAAFFADTLGWAPIDRPGNIGRPAAWLSISDDPEQELHLVEVEGYEPSAFEAEFGRHVALAYPAAGFADLKARLAGAGARLIEAGRPTPFERFFFRTPDGYVFEVVAAERGAEV